GASGSTGITRAELEQLISEAGFVPTLRDSFYNAL
ncbi:MAG: aminofutalosine synthase MqnE, partial [Quinella sp. 1Q7]|nr:aminofutalosine synthase MqnE [Quinella sp. 1Q7]